MIPQSNLCCCRESATAITVLVSAAVNRRAKTLWFRGLAAGIALSDMQYVGEATVDGLFFHDFLDARKGLDPAFIAESSLNEFQDTKP